MWTEAIEPITIPTRAAEPTWEPVGLAEVKQQVALPLSYTAHDQLLSGLIRQSREKVEHDSGIVCATGSFVWKRATWPAGTCLSIPLRPVSAITSITYVDSSGATQTWSSANYSLDANRPKPVVLLGYGQAWPTHRGYENDITITFVAGYSTATAIPQLVKQAVLLDVSREFNDRTGEGDADPHGGYARAYEMLIRRLQRSNYP